MRRTLPDTFRGSEPWATIRRMANDEREPVVEPDGPPPEPPPPPEEEDDGLVPDFLKRTIKSGVRTLSWGTEKVGAVGSTLNHVRQELVEVAGSQIVKYLEQLNLTEEAVKILTAISLEVKTEIRFIPNDQKLVTPDVKGSVSVKNADKAPAKKKKPRRRKAKKKETPAE